MVTYTERTRRKWRTKCLLYNDMKNSFKMPDISEGGIYPADINDRVILNKKVL